MSYKLDAMHRKEQFYKQLLIIALPMMIQFLITSSINFMDSFMIGKLGDSAVAALGVGNQYFFFFNIIVMGIMSGCNVLIAQYWGRKEVDDIRKTLGISLTLGVIVSLIFTIIGVFGSDKIVYIFNQENKEVMFFGQEYLKSVCLGYVFIAISSAFGIASRSINKAFTPMICSAIALLVNVVLNYGLIFGNLGMPALGVRGAAIATLIARFVEMAMILIMIYTRDKVLNASLKELCSYSKEKFSKTISVMMHVVFNELCWGLGAILYSVMYGYMGTESFAAFQICITIQNLFMIALMAVAGASSVMIGNEVGRGDIVLAEDYASRFMKLGILLGVLIGVSIILGSGLVLSIYDVSDQVKQYSQYILYLIGAIMPVRFITVLLIIGILRGGGDVKKALFIEIITMWCVGIPLCVLGTYVFKWPIHMVFALVLLEEISKLILSLKRYRSKKWIHNIIESEAA